MGRRAIRETFWAVGSCSASVSGNKRCKRRVVSSNSRVEMSHGKAKDVDGFVRGRFERHLLRRKENPDRVAQDGKSGQVQRSEDGFRETRSRNGSTGGTA